MKLKLIALAAMLAAGSAQAAIDTGNSSGNGELMLNLKWKDTNTTDATGNDSASAAFDLGITLDYAAANFSTAGFSQSWDLSSYGTAFSTFLGTTNLVLANAEMNVFALDSTGTAPGDARLLSTTAGINATGTSLSQTAAQTPTNNNFSQIFGNTTVVNFLTAVNNSASHDTVANGASNATVASGNAFFDANSGMDKFGGLSVFDSTNKFAGSYTTGSGILSGQAKALPFYMVVASSTDPFAKATMTPFGYDLDGDGVIEFDNNTTTVAGGSNEYGLWTLQGSTLTYSVAAVPEAETYAMMLAGLGLVGFMVRRRRNAI